MITPDSRPIGVLTPTILATASHWCIHRKGIADIRPASTLVLRVSDFDDDLPLLTCEGECYWNDDSGWMCYPCTLQPNGLVVPEPWPVLDGEEEIEHMRGVSADYVPHYRQSDGTHLSPRKGKTGIVWVWEKDRC